MNQQKQSQSGGKNNFIDLDNARLEEQKQVMQDIMTEGHCPFCTENLKKYHKMPILQEGEYWLVTENQWPYENTKHHFLLIYKEHAVDLAGLADEAGIELIKFVKWLEQTYQIKGGGFAMRFGDTDYSAGTVNHLHVQFIMPDIHKDGYKPVRVKIGK